MYNFSFLVNIIIVIVQGGVQGGRTSDRKFNGHSNEFVA